MVAEKDTKMSFDGPEMTMAAYLETDLAKIRHTGLTSLYKETFAKITASEKALIYILVSGVSEEILAAATELTSATRLVEIISSDNEQASTLFRILTQFNFTAEEIVCSMTVSPKEDSFNSLQKNYWDIKSLLVRLSDVGIILPFPNMSGLDPFDETVFSEHLKLLKGILKRRYLVLTFGVTDAIHLSRAQELLSLDKYVANRPAFGRWFRDSFSYLTLESPNRYTRPLINLSGIPFASIPNEISWLFYPHNDMVRHCFNNLSSVSMLCLFSGKSKLKTGDGVPLNDLMNRYRSDMDFLGIEVNPEMRALLLKRRLTFEESSAKRQASKRILCCQKQQNEKLAYTATRTTTEPIAAIIWEIVLPYIEDFGPSSLVCADWYRLVCANLPIIAPCATPIAQYHWKKQDALCPKCLCEPLMLDEVVCCTCSDGTKMIAINSTIIKQRVIKGVSLGMAMTLPCATLHIAQELNVSQQRAGLMLRNSRTCPRLSFEDQCYEWESISQVNPEIIAKIVNRIGFVHTMELISNPHVKKHPELLGGEIMQHLDLKYTLSIDPSIFFPQYTPTSLGVVFARSDTPPLSKRLYNIQHRMWLNRGNKMSPKRREMVDQMETLYERLIDYM